MKETGSGSRWFLMGLVAAMAIGSGGYRLLTQHRLEQTSAFFIGLPAVLAILLAATPSPKSATGIVMKGLTFFLLLSGIWLGEGFICIVMAAPLFYLVGFIVTKIVLWIRASVVSSVLLVPLVLASLEGVFPGFSFPREERITVERVVRGDTASVERSLASAPDFARPLPLFLRLRFPTPAAVWGEGAEPGAYRAIRFTGEEEPPGILVFRVSERSPGQVHFLAESDTSMIAHWLDWKEAEVRWTPAGPGLTRVRWTLRYTRRLDPAWYFGPWERYGVRLAAGYLIDAAATPAEVAPQ